MILSLRMIIVGGLKGREKWLHVAVNSFTQRFIKSMGSMLSADSRSQLDYLIVFICQRPRGENRGVEGGVSGDLRRPLVTSGELAIPSLVLG